MPHHFWKIGTGIPDKKVTRQKTIRMRQAPVYYFRPVLTSFPKPKTRLFFVLRFWKWNGLGPYFRFSSSISEIRTFFFGNGNGTCRSSQIFHFSADKVWSKPVFRFLFLYWNQVKYIYPIDGNIAIIFQLARTSRNMVTSRPLRFLVFVLEIGQFKSRSLLRFQNQNRDFTKGTKISFSVLVTK